MVSDQNIIKILNICVLVWLPPISNVLAETSAAHLIESCDKRMSVVGRADGKPQEIAETMDQFCEGYLSAFAEALAIERIICFKRSTPRPEYFESVFRIYLKSHPQSTDDTAQSLVRAALIRAFPCNR